MIICSSCHAGCCRRFNVPLTGYDIIKLKKTLQLEYLDFVHILKVDDEFLQKDGELVSVFKFNNTGSDVYFTFYLKSMESALFDNARKCLFLQEWNGKDLLLPEFEGIKARCGIYGARPLVCAIYPAKLNKNELIGIAKDHKKYINTPENPSYNLCPKDLDQSDFLDPSQELIQKLVLYEYEMKYFKFLAETWNQGSGDVSEFFGFLEAAYENRILFE